MHEIVDGIFHWTAHHDGIGMTVHSHYVEPAAVVLDPMVPPDVGLAWFEGRAAPPQQVVLTNRHHYRHSERFVEAFGCPVRVSEPGLGDVGGRPGVEPFAFGDEVAPGVTAIEIGAICPDETALHIAHGDGAMALADGVIRPSGGAPLSFVPDFLMDDPEATRQGLRDAYRGLLTRAFDTLLFAHGEPLVGGGRSALRDFVERPVGEGDHGDAAG